MTRQIILIDVTEEEDWEMEPLQPRPREEWEGDDPRYCIEPLQPRIDWSIGEPDMLVEYPA